MSPQAGDSKVPAAPPPPCLGSTWVHGTWNEPKESQREYGELTGISLPQLVRIGAQTRNEVQLEGKWLFLHTSICGLKTEPTPQMSVWQAKPRPTGSSLAVCNLAKGVDNFPFQRITAFQMKRDLQVLGWHTGFICSANSSRLLWLPGGPRQKDSRTASKLSREVE